MLSIFGIPDMHFFEYIMMTNDCFWLDLLWMFTLALLTEFQPLLTYWVGPKVLPLAIKFFYLSFFLQKLRSYLKQSMTHSVTGKQSLACVLESGLIYISF